MGKVFIQETTLTSIGDAIRSKAGTTDLISPLNMADAITNIPSGGGGDSGKTYNINLTNDCSAFDYSGRFSELLTDNTGTFNWTTSDIKGMSYGFYNDSNITKIPFVLNFKKTSSYQEYGIEDIFEYCTNLTTMPVMKGSVNGYINYMFSGCSSLDNVKFEDDFTISTNSSEGINMNSIFKDCINLKTITRQFPACDNGGELMRWQYFFSGCHNLREIPLDFFDKFKSTYGGANWNVSCQYIFRDCYSLRQYPNINFGLAGSRAYTQTFYFCVALDEVRDLAVISDSLSSNAFSSTFDKCNRLKAITFETNEDGTPKTARWSNQHIDLSRVGYAFDNYESGFILNYNSGITADKEVSDDGWNGTSGTYASYEALKNDPDWFTCDRNFSRYNLDSAIATINSLPDCSAGSGNTIKFDQYAGLHTTAEANGLPHQGAIGKLTEEQIAVATAKGWTVSLV